MSIAAVRVEPEAPAADTLCRLRLDIRNDGTETASQLGFRVRVNGVELPVYGNQLFMYPLPPGATTEVPLYNFWSTETGRPASADGTTRVEVSLVEAQWVEISMETDDEGEIEVWTPKGAVPGLPVDASITLGAKQAQGG